MGLRRQQGKIPRNSDSNPSHVPIDNFVISSPFHTWFKSQVQISSPGKPLLPVFRITARDVAIRIALAFL